MMSGQGHSKQRPSAHSAKGGQIALPRNTANILIPDAWVHYKSNEQQGEYVSPPKLSTTIVMSPEKSNLDDIQCHDFKQQL